jgi:hypothetical protein
VVGCVCRVAALWAVNSLLLVVGYDVAFNIRLWQSDF